MRQHWPRIAFVTLVFLLFLGNAAGVFRVEPGSASLPDISTSWPSFNELILTREFLLLAITGLILSIWLPQLEPMPASILTLASTVPPIYLGYINLLDPGILPMEYYLLTILILFVVNVLVSYYAYSHQRQQIIDTFSHYVPQEIVRKLCQQPDSFSLEGESRELTVLFADLVNFTSIAEQLNPKELTSLINHHFEVMSTVLLDHGATIDKYIGDSIMAFWGAPLAIDDHTDKAVAAAFALLDAVHEVSSDFSDRNWPPLELCIGINRGIMNVGNIGSAKRASYTVLGDAVNVASRLERLTRDYHVPIIVSDSVIHNSTHYSYRQLDRIILRGKQKPINIYQPMCERSAVDEPFNYWLNEHDAALALYLNKHHGQARSKFVQLQNNYPDDGYYKFMLTQIST